MAVGTGTPRIRDSRLKILLDNNIPQALRHRFPEHEVFTAFHQGWETLVNGRLLSAAEVAGFDLLVTLDRGFLHQHNFSGRKIAVALLIIERQSPPAFLSAIQSLLSQLDLLAPGTVTTIG